MLEAMVNKITAFSVEDIVAKGATLRERGVEIMEYDRSEVKPKDEVVDVANELHAWFMDPSQNSLGNSQSE